MNADKNFLNKLCRCLYLHSNNAKRNYKKSTLTDMDIEYTENLKEFYLDSLYVLNIVRDLTCNYKENSSVDIEYEDLEKIFKHLTIYSNTLENDYNLALESKDMDKSSYLKIKLSSLYNTLSKIKHEIKSKQF